MKGVIAAAGYGTRFLPITKTIPKEMLPLIDIPSIQLIIDEFISAGIEEIVMITSRRKKSLEDYFDREIELEELFRREGDTEKLKKITPPKVSISFIRQREMSGTGHALLQTRQVLKDEPFICAYPDDLHFGTPSLSSQLVDAYNETGCTVLAAVYNPPGLNSYGVLELDDDGIHVRNIVEKPQPGSEPSKEASIGRYLFTPDIFPHLQQGWDAHAGKGEYYHVYALKQLMDAGRVVSRRFSGERFDIGTPRGYLQAVMRYAEKHPEYAEILSEYLSHR